MINPLSKILDENRLTGPNYVDWKRNLTIVLTAEKVVHVLKSDPPKMPTDQNEATQEQIHAFEKWNESDQMAKCYILASMSNVLQKQHEDDRMSRAEIRAEMSEMAKKRKKADPSVGVTLAEAGPTPPKKTSQLGHPVLNRHGILAEELKSVSSEHDDEIHTLRCDIKSAQDELKKAELRIQDLEAKVKKNGEEAEAARALGREEFLKSPNFTKICAEKAIPFFYDGFQGCLTQFRANGYSEAENPASFLDADKAMDEVPEEDKVSGQEDGEGAEPEIPSPLV